MAPIVVADRYEINTNQRLPDLDTATSEAYAVTDLAQPNLPLYALKTQIFPCPRISTVELLTTIQREHPGLKIVNLVYAANIAWSDDSIAKSVALIYHRPQGSKVMTNLNQVFKPWTEEQVTLRVIMPIFDILQAFRQHGVSHRAIRPDNIFFDESAPHGSITLGEFCSMQPGYGQGVIFEPLSCALANPISRGESTISNDIYALGILISFLINGGNPCVIQDEDKILESRIIHGSFQTFMPKRPLSSGYLELLRALLLDNSDQRWTLKELGNWLATGRQSHILPQSVRKAARPIALGGRDDIYTPTLLAYEMRRNPGAAVDLILKSDLLMWLKNSLNDQVRVHQMEDLKAAMPSSASSSEKLLAVLQILDRKSPLFWGGKSFTLPGMGYMMASAVNNNERLDIYQKLLSSSVLAYSVGENEEIIKRLQNLKMYVENHGFGGGVERCIYYLCPDVPCLSPFLKSYNVLKTNELLIALNHLGSCKNRPEYPVDRHVAGFIAAREMQTYQNYFHEMDSRFSQRKIVAMMALLAELQIKTKTAGLPNLCHWLVELANDAISNYRNVRTQEFVRKKLHEFADVGDLSAIVKILNNPKALEVDRQSLKQAQIEAQKLNQQARALYSSFISPVHYSEKIGQNNAMILSTFMAMGFSFFYLIIKAIS